MEDDDYHHLNKIEDNLWLGNSFAAGEVKDLKEKGITKILTVMNGFPNKDGTKPPVRFDMMRYEKMLCAKTNKKYIEYLSIT